MKRFFWLIFFGSIFLKATSFAVIIDGGDGSGNTNAPPDDPGWDRVGHISIANPDKLSTVTYLGDKWFITAYHVKYWDNPGAVELNGSVYNIDSGSWVRLTNSVGDGVDLTMFQVTTRPDVLPLRIRSSRIPVNADVVMIGDGKDRGAFTYWNAAWQETNEVSAVYSGYIWAPTASMRWGENRVSSRNSFDDGFGNQYGFQTTFNEGAGSNECQAAKYDSGGAVFYKNGSDWELAGIMLSTAMFENQPDSTAVYGNQTFIADISYYRDQITNLMDNFDSDIDGLPDWWESEYSAGPTNLVASEDSDSDGFTNLEEWYADTDPTNSASFLEIDTISALSNQTVGFVGSTNRQYRLSGITNLIDGTWGPESDFVFGTGSNSSITVTNTDDSVFYRLEATLP